MNWLTRILEQRQQEREASRLSTDQLDRQYNPELYRNWEIPAIWNRGDLAEGDHKRDKR
jgi:hypothetical protein